MFSISLSLDQDNLASDVLATRVLSIDVPSTRDGANVRVHDTIPVNDDGKTVIGLIEKSSSAFA